MIRCMMTAATGMEAQQLYMDTISNNLSNVNTNGFKRMKMEFQDLMYQTLRLSLFTFYSPTDEDWHLRPAVSYKYSDEITLTAGGNFFGGDKAHTMFGQFAGNNNLYARFRYGF